MPKTDMTAIVLLRRREHDIKLKINEHNVNGEPTPVELGRELRGIQDQIYQLQKVVTPQYHDNVDYSLPVETCEKVVENKVEIPIAKKRKRRAKLEE